MKNQAFMLLFTLLVFQPLLFAQSKGMVSIKGSRYIPLYGRDSTVVEVNNFEIDIYPVTNADYVNFVKQYPKWQKSKVIKLFADTSYLSNWKSDLELKDSEKPNSPRNLYILVCC